MKRIEIKDLCALLRTIVTPADDLALAHVLRSPIFSLSNIQLIEIANTDGENWFQRLRHLAESGEASASIDRAVALLTQWQALATRLPLHDLVTTIFHQGNIINRYLAAFPDWQSAQLNSNLQRFVELALEVNSGRYPGIHHFLQHLQLQAKASDNESISEPSPTENSNAVDILTIHEAKGLEAPVVFVANLNEQIKASGSGEAAVHWPPNEKKPILIALQTKTDKRDALLNKLHKMQQEKESREVANLLYVALTRAKQLLIISASKIAAKKPNPDLKLLRKALTPITRETDEHVLILESSPATYATDTDIAAAVTTEKKLSTKLNDEATLPAFDTEIAPSRTDQESIAHGSNDGRLRGTVIHQFLHQLIENPELSDAALLSRVGASNSEPEREHQ